MTNAPSVTQGNQPQVLPPLTDGPLSDDLQRALMGGIAVLFKTNPFWAAFAMSPKLTIGKTSKFAEQQVGITTAATDCKRTIALYEPFFRHVHAKAQANNAGSTMAGIITYVCLHELAHILMDDANELTQAHMPDEKLRAMAVDYRVFELLRADGFLPPAAFLPFTLDDYLAQQKGQYAEPRGCHATTVFGDINIAKHVPDHADVTAIYRWLEANQNKQPQGGGGGPKLSLNGDAINHNSPPPPGQGQGQDPSQDPQGGTPPPGSGSAQPDPSKIRDEILGEAAAAAAMMGRMSEAANRVANALFKSTTPWEQQLRNLVRSAAMNGPRERTFRRLGRRTYTSYQQELQRNARSQNAVAYPAYMPGPATRVVVAIDTSGSIDDDTLKVFAAELTAILASKCVSEACVVYCADQTADGEVFRPGQKVQLRSPITGGTDFEPVWHWQRKNVPDAAAIIYLTDLVGLFGARSTWPKCPVIWAKITDLHPPFGKSVRVKIRS